MMNHPPGGPQPDIRPSDPLNHCWEHARPVNRPDKTRSHVQGVQSHQGRPHELAIKGETASNL